uniref:Uncharacterized protein n=1 Tax=Aegilops tauschii subsp. strangulata TaxID=200361 RepID=A0A453H263_AEGTS
MLLCPSLVTTEIGLLVFLRLFLKLKRLLLQRKRRNLRGTLRMRMEVLESIPPVSRSITCWLMMNGRKIFSLRYWMAIMLLISWIRISWKGVRKQREILGKIRKKKAMLIQEHRMKKSTAESRPIVPRKHDKDRKFTTKRLGRQLTSMGVDPTAAVNRLRSQSRGRKRERSLSRADGDDAMDVDGQHSDKKLRTRSRSRSKSRPIEEVVPG